MACFERFGRPDAFHVRVFLQDLWESKLDPLLVLRIPLETVRTTSLTFPHVHGARVRFSQGLNSRTFSAVTISPAGVCNYSTDLVTINLSLRMSEALLTNTT